MYGNDTFFHLTLAGQAGLAVLSLSLGIACVWIHLQVSSRFGLFVKALLAILVLWIFDWFSPQLYYAYYSFLFDDLPSQLVIGKPKTPSELLHLASFTGPATLSDHARGLLFWLMTGGAILQWRYDNRP